MTGKPLPFTYRSRSNGTNSGDIFQHRSPNRTSNSNSRPFYENNNFKPLNRSGSTYPRTQSLQNNKKNYNSNYGNNSRAQSPNYSINGNRCWEHSQETALEMYEITLTHS